MQEIVLNTAHIAAAEPMTDRDGSAFVRLHLSTGQSVDIQHVAMDALLEQLWPSVSTTPRPFVTVFARKNVFRLPLPS